MQVAASALPTGTALDPEGLVRLTNLSLEQASFVAPCRVGRRVLLHDAAERGATYGTKQAPGVDPMGARWSVAIFVYARGSHVAARDLLRLTAVEAHCRKRGSVTENGIVWSVRHVGGVKLMSGGWKGYRVREAEFTRMKQDPLRLTATYWARGNVLVEIDQVVPASRSIRMTDSWLATADALVLGALI